MKMYSEQQQPGIMYVQSILLRITEVTRILGEEKMQLLKLKNSALSMKRDIAVIINNLLMLVLKLLGFVPLGSLLANMEISAPLVEIE